MAAATSFQKKVKAKVRQIPGTKVSLYKSQLLVSSGIPSLDAILGGGIAVGTVILIEEDVGAKYAEVMTRYFLAEGVVSNHAMLVISADKNPQEMLQRLPQPIEDVPSNNDAEQKSTPQASGDADDKMSIAWRYRNQPKVQPAPSSSKFGHYYNLSKCMDQQTVSAVDTAVTSFSDLIDFENEQPNGVLSTYCRYRCVLEKIRKRIAEGNFGTAVKSDNKNILRIAIHGLGSVLWGDSSVAQDEGAEHDTSLFQFLLALRSILRRAYSVCLLTIPTHQFQDPALVKRVEWLCDTVLRLESFAASTKAKNPAFRDYSGLLHLLKLPSLNEIKPHMPETLDLAFRCRRKKFTIEKLHLPPELSDTVSREQEDPVPSLRPSSGCSSLGSGISKLDF